MAIAGHVYADALGNFLEKMDFVQYVYASLFWLSLGCFYFLAHNIFITLVYLEFAALATGVLLVLQSLRLDDRYYEFMGLSLITLAGAESAIAISLLVNLSRSGIQLSAAEFANLKV